ncbi:IS3 family transposase [Peribacillus asahii]|nr:IS3 family transposase [Peribacillus asahii]
MKANSLFLQIAYYNTKRIKAKLKMSPIQYRTHFEQAA